MRASGSTSPRGTGTTVQRHTVRQRSSPREWPLVKLAAIFCVAILGTGCLADPAGPSLSASNGTLPSEAHVPGAVEADFVARALALAMNDLGIRVLVRDAMRGSAVTEHKLVLQEFAVSEAGRTVVDAAARAVGIPSDSLQRIIASIPPSDFYVPNAEHRMRWRGEGNAFVAAAFAHDLTNVTATRSDGSRRLLRPADRASVSVVFHLQPAERKS